MVHERYKIIYKIYYSRKVFVLLNDYPLYLNNLQLVVFNSLMLPTIFCCLSIGSGEKRLCKVFNIYGHSGRLGDVTQIICIYFHACAPISFHMKFGSK